MTDPNEEEKLYAFHIVKKIVEMRRFETAEFGSPTLTDDEFAYLCRQMGFSVEDFE
jgi:hypothetical protein